VVEKRSGTTNLEKLGGLAKLMPVAFITFFIASLAISGVPPFNGFVSKWMVYQGLIEVGKQGGSLWILWLAAAMFGSALTLASFMKLLHAVFLGQPSSQRRETAEHRKKTGISMTLPISILAALCVVFGVFAYRIPLSLFVFPSLPGSVAFTGVWSSSLATMLLIVGLLVGGIIYFLGTVTKTKESEGFVGGESLSQHPDMRISGVEFYNTVKDIRLFGFMYRLADYKAFDIYDVGRRITFCFTAVLRYIHNGVLPSYLTWCLLGMIVLFYVLFR
jgi:NADH:ubiquinone oxidoreductase subunit 5 (subunit L)/multisubunit Na+/H+ antiporter MnhA subunit